MNPHFPNHIFREYDIRGVYGTDFDEAFAYRLGLCFAYFVSQQSSGRSEIGVGWDCRLSSGVLSTALIEGLRTGNCDVLEVGLGPTAQLYFATHLRKLAGGVHVTASHNGADCNGFKLTLGSQALYGRAIQELREVLEQSYRGELPTATAKGSLRTADIAAPYIDELVNLSKPHIGKRPLRVVVDCGNSVGALVGLDVLTALGFAIVPLFSELDGNFPNHPPDPSCAANLRFLQDVVLKEHADFGVAWDGDADRIGIVDERGKIVENDILLLLFGEQVCRQLKHPLIVADVKCSRLVFSHLAALGATVVMSASGHSPIKTKMKEVGAALAGELSGHMFFADRYFGYDDGIYAACRLAEIVSNTELSLSELVARFPRVVATPETRFSCDEKMKDVVVAEVCRRYVETSQVRIDGVRLEFPDSWVLVRASNTEPAIVLRIEANDERRLDELRQTFEVLIRSLISKS